MRVGVVFPQTEIESDAGAVREFAVAISELGYTHVLAYDHVVGADPAVHRRWDGPYEIRDPFFEPLVLFSYLAAFTSLELVSAILILPQRQTVLVAKQAATVDVLSGGRLRLGVGLGWNPVEYEALGEDFASRGTRIAEQVELMRTLWTVPSVTFRGAQETVTAAGIAPLPVQRPIPVWFGAKSPRALRRAGRLADGWFPELEPGPELTEATEIVRSAAAEAGRDPDAIGIEGRINIGPGDQEKVSTVLEQWREARASYVSLNTMRAGLRTADEHIAALASAAEAVTRLERRLAR
jgi:probable F420-dependent oxidoreductase